MAFFIRKEALAVLGKGVLGIGGWLLFKDVKIRVILIDISIP